MALNNFGLGFVLTAQDLASGVINRTRASLLGLGATADVSGRMMRAGMAVAMSGIAPLAAGVAGLATSMALADVGGQFEQGVQRVANVSGATAEELRQLRDAAIEAGIATHFTPAQAIEGLENLASLGFTASESMQHLQQSLDLAAGGMIPIEEATFATGAAIRVFNLNADEAATVADRLLGISNLTALRAGDLSLALGTVARGAGVAKQNLNEMLISMGLVRNTGVDTSVAASSVSRALLEMAQNADKFRDTLGVEVTDANGNFRDFLDVVAEADTALSERFPNAAERAAAATELFGTFGLTAFQAATTQLHGMVGTVPGINSVAGAIDHLRGRMEATEGTAETFTDRILDTFAGQKQVLTGAMATVETLLGESFAAVFKPIVKAIVGVVQGIARFINEVPEEIRTATAGFFVFMSAVMAVGGAFTILTGIFLAMLPFMNAILMAMAIGTALAAPFILAIGAAGLAIVGLREVFNSNIGGIADYLRGVWHKVRIAFTALRQLFTQGFLSGPIVGELQKNQGVHQFVITMFRIGRRVVHFFEGIGAGFRAAMVTLQPAIQGFMGSFNRLLVTLGLVNEDANGLANSPMETWAERGAQFGHLLARSLEIVIYAFTGITEVVSDVILFFRNLYAMWQTMTNAFTVMSLRVSTVWANTIDGIKNGVDEAIVTMGGLLARIPGPLRPSGANASIVEAEHAQERINARNAAISARNNVLANVTIGGAMPAAEEAKGRGQQSATMGQALGELRAQRAADLQARLADAKRPVQVNVQVDGETVARATANASRSEESRSFVPGVPSEV